MTPTEYPLLHERLVQLAEALGGKAPTQAGMVLWVQTLKEFSFVDVSDQLDAWAKRSTRMPAPADIWKPCNELRTTRIERSAVAEKSLFEREANRTFQRSDKLGKALRQLAAELRDAQPRDPKEWAQVLWHRFIADRPNPDGSAMSEMQIEMACRALGHNRSDANEARDSYRRARVGVAA